MSAAAGIIAALGAALDVPVGPPGSTAGTLPAVHVVPADDLIDPAGRWIVHRFDVRPTVARGVGPASLDQLESLEVDTIRALLAAGYRLDDRVRYVGDDDEIQTVARIITAEVTGNGIC